VLAVIGAGEFGLRCFSYQRALQYEEQADLLYTPIPEQDFIEKISLTRSHINHLGLRGKDARLESAKHVILCLGDSVTFGYGVDEEHTYPAELQRELDRRDAGKFVVLNGGVDAYPMTLVRHKFLSLWAQGVHPDVVIVGYSFNERGAGELIQRNDKLHSRLQQAFRLKNFLRRFALYNIVVENWARKFYDRAKGYVVRGVQTENTSPDQMHNSYQDTLRDLVEDVRARHATPVFLLFSGLNPETKQYDIEAPYQKQFKNFAESHRLTLLTSGSAFANKESNHRTQEFLLDQCHLNRKGTEAVAAALGQKISGMFGEKP
jgi:lysophospholipase L1-like esterase